MSLSLANINSLLSLSCIIGLGLSIYAYTIELQLENDSKYAPMCDINAQVSCSRAFKSEYGKGFGIFERGSILHQPNSLFGIFFYSLIATLNQVNFKYTAYLSYFGIVLSNLSSLYFAYILYFKLYDFCIVCVSIYIVNFVNLILIRKKLAKMTEIETTVAESNKKTN